MALGDYGGTSSGEIESKRSRRATMARATGNGADTSRTLAVACAAHALHDGYTDSIFVFLPLWQSAFGLDYAALAAMRGIYAGTMAALQIPSSRLAERIGPRLVLAGGTLLAALGYMLAGFAGGIVALCIALTLSGAGSSTQHPQASFLVSTAYGEKARGPLGTYNFAGDVGKAALPASASLLIHFLNWQPTLWVLAAIGLSVVAFIWIGLPAGREASRKQSKPERLGEGHGGFFPLLMIGVLDSAVRMGFLTFLPFLLRHRGASIPLVGCGLAAVFIGGGAGKICCAWIGTRLGTFWTVVATEGGTAFGILVILFLPLWPTFVVLPFLGVVLNGTSSVLYGTVPEVSRRADRAFAVFYTGTIGAGAIAPVLYGLVGDGFGTNMAVIATAATAIVIIPLAYILSFRIRH